MPDFWDGYGHSTQLDLLRKENERLKEALTPSPANKFRHSAEYSVHFTTLDEAGNEYTERVDVPWTTVKAIMRGIREVAGID